MRCSGWLALYFISFRGMLRILLIQHIAINEREHDLAACRGWPVLYYSIIFVELNLYSGYTTNWAILNQWAYLYWSVCLENSIQQLKHCLAPAIHEIKHSAYDLDVNQALGCASYFISIFAVHLVLYFTYSTRGNALTNTYN